MRFATKLMAAIVIVLAVLTQTPASASWCAQYAEGRESCVFSTFEQCQASVSPGTRGFCRPSQYDNPGYASAGRVNKKRRY
jgi:Protein of unknown function (DUF3551)